MTAVSAGLPPLIDRGHSGLTANLTTPWEGLPAFLTAVTAGLPTFYVSGRWDLSNYSCNMILLKKMNAKLYQVLICSFTLDHYTKACGTTNTPITIPTAFTPIVPSTPVTPCK